MTQEFHCLCKMKRFARKIASCQQNVKITFLFCTNFPLYSNHCCSVGGKRKYTSVWLHHPVMTSKQIQPYYELMANGRPQPIMPIITAIMAQFIMTTTLTWWALS